MCSSPATRDPSSGAALRCGKCARRKTDLHCTFCQLLSLTARVQRRKDRRSCSLPTGRVELARFPYAYKHAHFL